MKTIAWIILPVAVLIIFALTRQKKDMTHVRSGTEFENKIRLPLKDPVADDFLAGDPWAISNAVRFMSPPEGWDIVCDKKGHYAAREGGYVRDFTSPGLKYIRTSHHEAVIVAWRLKGLMEAMVARPYIPVNQNSTNLWMECDDNP